MALQVNKTFDTGLTASASYARIGRVVAMHEPGNDTQFIEVKFYASAQAFVDGKQPVEVKTFARVYDDTASVSLSQLYAWLKLPYSEDANGNPIGGPEGDIFVGAVDV